MRIRQLLLSRYGHLTDVALSFGPAHGLHVILGQNEAGKSTALSAIGDALFGFPHKTVHDFLHDRRDLAIGIEVVARDGREAFFWRRKRRNGDLSDAAGAPVAESAAAAFLAGAGRDRFERVFGLDATRLRQGGEELLKGKGEIYQSIVGAYTGTRNVSGVLKALQDEAGRLHGDRRGRRAVQDALESFREAKRDLDSRAVPPSDWQKASDERAALAASRAANAAKADGLRLERVRLDRIRRTAPARRALAALFAERTALGPLPPLPHDAAARRADALLEGERLRRDVVRERAAHEAACAERDAIAVDTGLLAEAAAVDCLAGDVSRIAAATRERDAARIDAAQQSRELEQAGRALGLAHGADALAALVPDRLKRAEADRAIRVHDQLAGRRATLDQDAVALGIRREAAERALAALPSPSDPGPLRTMIEAVRGEGPLDAACEAARMAAAEEADALAQALAALPRWTGTADALAALPVPLAAALAEASDRLARADFAVQEHARDVLALERRLADIEADIAAIRSAGEPPTAEVIASARSRRDRGWALLRRVLLEGGAPATPEEQMAFGDVVLLPDLLTRLIAEADRLADASARESKRVAQFDVQRGERARTEAQLASVRAQRSAATVGRDDALAAWLDLWRPSGVDPGPPAVMQEWLTRRETVVAAWERARAAAEAARRAASRRAEARSQLKAALPLNMVPPGEAVAPVLQVAEQRLATLDRMAQARAAAERDAAEAEAGGRALAAQRAVLASETAEADARWRRAAQGLGLAAALPVDAGRPALEAWNDIDARARAWRGSADRVIALSGEIERFTAEAARLIGLCAPDLAAAAPLEAAAALAARADAARHAAERRAATAARAVSTEAALGALERQVQATEDALAALRSVAGAADDAALLGVIERAAAHADVARKIAEREAELRPLDDGRTLAELEAEAEGVDAESLAGRIAAIDDLQRTLGTENEALAVRITELDATLQRMAAGRDASAAAQVMRDALADASEAAQRYVRVRLATALLEDGIKRFREQRQGPLLERAGDLFRRLTDGRYARLIVDEQENGTPAIVGRQPDGTRCPADRLSEGTRDQLYLALRLAAIEVEAAQAEPLPFIADDLLVNFDDQRAEAGLRVLADFGAVTQTILFTHHAHIAERASRHAASLQELPGFAGPKAVAAD